MCTTLKRFVNNNWTRIRCRSCLHWEICLLSGWSLSLGWCELNVRSALWNKVMQQCCNFLGNRQGYQFVNRVICGCPITTLGIKYLHEEILNKKYYIRIIKYYIRIIKYYIRIRNIGTKSNIYNINKS